MSVAGRTDLNGGFRLDVLNTPITVSFRDDYADAPAHAPLFQEEKARGVMKAGSPGAAICDELTPKAGDIVINKHGADPFNSTHLANVLRPRASRRWC
jgi:nicotinamidase-related amidase